MSDASKIRDLAVSNSADHVSSSAKLIFGLLPYGSLIGELAASIIPNQKHERLIKFIGNLDRRLSHMEAIHLRERLMIESVNDLLEDGMISATRSLSDDRREYIASIVSNGIDSEGTDLSASKHLMRILDSIQDVEILLLRSLHRSGDDEADKEFMLRHADVVTATGSMMDPDPAIRQKLILLASYKDHLDELGLLDGRYQLDKETPKLAEFGRRDRSGFGMIDLSHGLGVSPAKTTKLRSVSYSVSHLGVWFMREIGLISDGGPTDRVGG